MEHGDLVVGQQVLAAGGVAGDEINLAQDASRSEGEVFRIAGWRAYNIEGTHDENSFLAR
jgi:hypothetical protein